MTSRIYVDHRGGAGFEDITDLGNRVGVPFFDEDGGSLVDLPMRYNSGEAGQGTYRLMIPTNEHVNMPGHAITYWSEDAPGAEVWLFRGRLAGSEGGRGVEVIDVAVEFDMNVDDGNVELRGQAFTEPWVRPEETDYARIVALQAYTLNGASSTADYFRETCQVTASSTHLAPNSATVTMPAKKYAAGTQPQEVIADCAQMAGKEYGVVIHHAGGSHLCLLYITSDDHSTYSTAAKISDQLADWDPLDGTAPVWEPHWEMGRATTYDGQTLLSGVVTTWGAEQAFFTQNVNRIEDYDYWVESFSDGFSVNSTQAANRATAILTQRYLTLVSHKVSVIVQPEQVDLVTAGMSIQIKSAAALGGQHLDTWQTRRIAELRWEPRQDGTYFAHMSLDRPTRRTGPSTGLPWPQPPQASVPSDATTDYLWTFTDSGFDDIPGDTHEGGPKWSPGYIYSGGLDPVCKIGSGVGGPVELGAGTFHFRAIVRSRSSSTKAIRVRDSGVTIESSGAVVGSAATEVTFDFTLGSPTAITIESGGDGTDGNNTEFHEVEISHAGTTEAFVGTPPPPAATDSIGDTGTSSIYSPSDHQHPVQTSDVTPIVDEEGNFDGATVEDALQELSDEIAAIGLQYLPLTTVDGGDPVLVWDEDNSLIPTEIVFD